METFFYVILPGAAIALFVLAVVIWMLFWGIPKIRSLKYQNRQFKNRELTEGRLSDAERLIERIVDAAEDDTMLEVNLGSRRIRELKEFIEKQPHQLER